MSGSWNRWNRKQFYRVYKRLAVILLNSITPAKIIFDVGIVDASPTKYRGYYTVRE
jgi:hypothetical protein